MLKKKKKEEGKKRKVFGTSEAKVCWLKSPAIYLD
jgi:hypothetical protein